MSRLAAAYRALQYGLLPEPVLVRRFIARQVAPLAPSGRALDLGGGIAPFGGALRAALPACRPLVLDIDASARPTIVGDAARLPLAGGSVAFVALFQVLQHLPAPAAALAEARRVLDAGGLLLVTYPFLYPEGRTRDLWRWTRSGMTAELAAAGFETVADETCGGFCFLMAQLAASLPPRWLIRHRGGWRTGRSAGDVMRLGLSFALALPFHLLGFLALAVDRVLPASPYHIGGIVLARKRADG